MSRDKARSRVIAQPDNNNIISMEPKRIGPRANGETPTTDDEKTIFVRVVFFNLRKTQQRTRGAALLPQKRKKRHIEFLLF